jgi:hypothetical protein
VVELTDRLTVVAQGIIDILERDKAELGIEDVFYGDQSLINGAAVVCVEPGVLQRELAGGGASNRTENILTVFILVYIIGFAKGSNESIRKENDELGERIATRLHEDPQLGGLVNSSFIHSIESGYRLRGDQTHRTARLTWQGTSKTYLSRGA